MWDHVTHVQGKSVYTRDTRNARVVHEVRDVTHVTRKQFDTRKRITVYLSAEEYAAIEALASGNVSNYARKTLLAGNHEANTIPDVRPATDVHDDVGRESHAVRLLASTVCSHCGHGKETHKGFASSCVEGKCRCGGFL